MELNIILVFTFLAVNMLMAVSDALKDTGKKTLSKVIEVAGIAVFLFILVIGFSGCFYYSTGQIIWLLVSFILLRLAVFNLTYVITFNIARRGIIYLSHLPLWYLGKTDPVDKLFIMFLNKTKFPQGLFMLNIYLFSLILGISFIFNYIQ